MLLMRRRKRQMMGVKEHVLNKAPDSYDSCFVFTDADKTANDGGRQTPGEEAASSTMTQQPPQQPPPPVPPGKNEHAKDQSVAVVNVRVFN